MGGFQIQYTLHRLFVAEPNSNNRKFEYYPLVVQCQDERSQIKNFDKAMTVLRSRLYEIELAKRNAEIAGARKSLVGSGDRSDKIRTYNYPQGRVTDHRIGLTVYNLPTVLDGEIGEFIEQLRIAENAERLTEGAV